MKGKQKKKSTEAPANNLTAAEKIQKSGYAGILADGSLVDRRFEPKATPVPENELLGIPEPVLIHCHCGELAEYDHSGFGDFCCQKHFDEVN